MCYNLSLSFDAEPPSDKDLAFKKLREQNRVRRKSGAKKKKEEEEDDDEGGGKQERIRFAKYIAPDA